MSDIDPQQIQHATEATTGFMGGIAAALTTALAAIGGFIFKDQNQRLKTVERTHTEIKTNMATRSDIEEIYKKIDKNHEKTIDRIIEIVREGK